MSMFTTSALPTLLIAAIVPTALGRADDATPSHGIVPIPEYTGDFATRSHLSGD